MTPNPIIEPELVETLRYQYAHEGAPEETREAANAITALQEKVRRLEAAAHAFLERFDGCCRADTDFVAELLRTALNGSPDQ